jgi:hypothetical protein
MIHGANQPDEAQLRGATAMKNSHFQDRQIDRNLRLDNSKISNLTFLVCGISMIDNFCFALPFSVSEILEPEMKWDMSHIILSIAICFGSPTNWLLPHALNKLFFKSPDCLMLAYRILQTVSIGVMILSFYHKTYWLFCLARVLHYLFFMGSYQATNHMIRTSEQIHKDDSAWFTFWGSDRSINDIIVFVAAVCTIQYWTWAASPLLGACWIVFGISCLNIILTFVQNATMQNLIILGDKSFRDFIKSDQPLTREEFYKQARSNMDEDYDNLLGEEKFGRFLNSEKNKRKYPKDKKITYLFLTLK